MLFEDRMGSNCLGEEELGRELGKVGMRVTKRGNWRQQWRQSLAFRMKQFLDVSCRGFPDCQGDRQSS